MRGHKRWEEPIHARVQRNTPSSAALGAASLHPDPHHSHTLGCISHLCIAGVTEGKTAPCTNSCWSFCPVKLQWNAHQLGQDRGFALKGCWKDLQLSASLRFHFALDPRHVAHRTNTRHCFCSAKLAKLQNKHYGNLAANRPYTLCLRELLHDFLLSPAKEGGAEGCLPRGITPSSLKARNGVAKQASDPGLQEYLAKARISCCSSQREKGRDWCTINIRTQSPAETALISRVADGSRTKTFHRGKNTSPLLFKAHRGTFCTGKTSKEDEKNRKMVFAWNRHQAKQNDCVAWSRSDALTAHSNERETSTVGVFKKAALQKKITTKY